MTKRHARARLRTDDGFSLLEAVMAAVVLGIASLLIAGLVLNTLRVTKDSGNRTAAADIAASQLERVRQTSPLDIPDGRTTATVVKGNTTYTVIQDAIYQTSSNSTSACDPNGTLSYKRVTMEVTWPDMGTTKPVRSETLKALGFDQGSGGLDATRGAMAVMVQDQAGNPVAGATTRLQNINTGATSVQQVTGADGCAVFPNQIAGVNMRAQVWKGGWINPLGAQVSQTGGQGIIASALVRTSAQLGQSSRLSVLTQAPKGAIAPAGALPSLSANSSSWPSPSTRMVPPCATTPDGFCVTTTANTIQLDKLFPGAYSVWFGQCTAMQNTSSLTQVTPGGSDSATVQLGAVPVAAGNATVVGSTVYATSATDSGCATGHQIQLGTLGGLGETTTYALPPGQWYIQLNGSPTATRVASQGAAVAPGTVAAPVQVIS